MQNRNRKKTARTYSSESLMLRGVLGVLLCEQGVLKNEATRRDANG